MTNLIPATKEAAGYIGEEVGEIVDIDSLATKGRRLRNEGRVAQGKAPIITKPGIKTKKPK